MKVNNCGKCQVCPVVRMYVQIILSNTAFVPPPGQETPIGQPTRPIPSLMKYAASVLGHFGGGLFVGFIPADHSRYRCSRYQLM